LDLFLASSGEKPVAVAMQRGVFTMPPDTSAARTTTRPSLSVRNTGGGVDIGDPRLRAIANRAEQTLQLAALRALASLASPAVYPPAAAENSIEPLIRSMFGKRNAAKQQSAISKATSILGGPQQGLTDRSGALAAIDLHSTVPVEVQANAVPVPEALRLSETDFLNLTMANNHLVISSGHPLLSPVPPISPSGDSLRSPLITVLDPVQDKYLKLGGEQGFLGKPVAPETTAPDGVGRFRHYQGGSIYWSPTTGAHEVHGPIRNKWASLLWERSTLGYPTTDEIGTPDKVGRYNHFQGGSIYWDFHRLPPLRQSISGVRWSRSSLRSATSAMVRCSRGAGCDWIARNPGRKRP
jgi:hypothetical protein